MIEIIINVMSEDRIAKYLEQDKKLIIPTPPDSLIELFILSLIPQFARITAEHDYSVENVSICNKTLGKFNKNYAELIALIKNVFKTKTKEVFNNLITFINELNPDVLSECKSFTKWTNYCYNIKHSTNLVECLEFVIFKYNIY